MASGQTPSRDRLAGKVAIVTGSGRGIGRAEALLMADEGAAVVVSDMGVDHGTRRAEVVAGEIRSTGGQAVATTDDLSTFEGARRTVGAAFNHFGRLDIVLNNAGLRRVNPIQDMTEEDFDIVVGSHLKATFGVIKYAACWFIEQRAGVILNTSSEAGLGHPYNSAYSAAKEGITGLTRTIARELGPYGVRCNLIRPRASGTESEEFIAAVERLRPRREALGRFALGKQGDRSRRSGPEDAAVLAVWLCTDAAAKINGQDFFVMGDEVGLWSEPDLLRTVHNADAWTLDSLDEYATGTLVHGLENRFLGV